MGIDASPLALRHIAVVEYEPRDHLRQNRNVSFYDHTLVFICWVTLVACYQ